MEFSDNLKRIRKKNKMTQSDLAMEAGITLRTVQRFESGAANPTLDSMESLAQALNVNHSELLGAKDPISIMIENLIEENTFKEGGKEMNDRKNRLKILKLNALALEICRTIDDLSYGEAMTTVDIVRALVKTKRIVAWEDTSFITNQKGADDHVD